ncbi:MAG: cupin domain-containing protein [Sphingobacteriales bacterium]|nr:MAG: cupin domain-containing protein [Sphingobacteriales bacterium]
MKTSKTFIPLTSESTGQRCSLGLLTASVFTVLFLMGCQEVKNDSTYQTVVGNVYFEPGARSNWHIHPAGQILIITAGVGYHQLKGQPRQTMRKGDVVQCPPNVMHWHGATPDSGLHQMYILPNTEKGIVKWLHPVSDEEYNASNPGE